MSLNLLPQAERLLSGQLAESLSDIATEVDVDNPPDSAKLPTFIEIDPDSDNPETVRVVGVTGSTITIERGVYNGGVGTAHQPNATWKQKFSQKHWDALIAVLQTGYLSEDTIYALAKVDADTFTITGVDRTDYMTAGRRLRINGTLFCTVASSSYGAGATTVDVIGDTVPTPITSLEYVFQPMGYPFDITSTLVTTVPEDVAGSGIKITMTAGENLVFGNACYIKSDGKIWKADASVIATSSAVFMALATISADASGSFLYTGIARNDAWNWTVGGLIFLSETAGAMTQTAPTPTDTVTQILGVATHADRMLFAPQLVQVEHT